MRITSDDGKVFGNVADCVAYEAKLKEQKTKEEAERKARIEEDKRKKEESKKEFELLNYELRAAYKTLYSVYEKISDYERKTGTKLGIRHDCIDGDYSLFEVGSSKLRYNEFVDNLINDVTKCLRMK